MRPVNIRTPHGVFVGLDNYVDKGYYNWINKKAKLFVNNIQVEDRDDDINWLEGEAIRCTNPVEQGRLRDLIIAKKMVDEGILQQDFDGEYIGYRGYWETWKGAIINAIRDERQRQQPISIRGLDMDLYKKARAQAVREGKNIGDWLNISIKKSLAQSIIDEEEHKRNSLPYTESRN